MASPDFRGGLAGIRGCCFRGSGGSKGGIRIRITIRKRIKSTIKSTSRRRGADDRCGAYFGWRGGAEGAGSWACGGVVWGDRAESREIEGVVAGVRVCSQRG